MPSPCPFVFHSVLLCFTLEYSIKLCHVALPLFSQDTPDTRRRNRIILYCSILQDKAGMGYHHRSIHHLNLYSLDNHLQLCKRKIQPNNNYNNPGNLKFVSHLSCDKCAQSRPSAP